MDTDFVSREHAPGPMPIASDGCMTVQMSVGLPCMHVIEQAAVVKVGSRSRGTKPVGQKIHTDSKTSLKKSHTILQGLKWKCKMTIQISKFVDSEMA